MRKILILTTFCLTLASAPAISSESLEDKRDAGVMNADELQSLYTQHEIVIDGKRTPEAVPFEVKMHFFFNRYRQSYRERLSGSLSPEDDAALFRFSEAHAEFRSQNVNDVTLQELAICSRAEAMDGVALAIAFEEAAQNAAAARDKQYRNWLNALSPIGRKAVLDFVQRNIKPTVITHNPVAVATAAPHEYKEGILHLCKTLLLGDKSNASEMPRLEQNTSGGEPFGIDVNTGE